MSLHELILNDKPVASIRDLLGRAELSALNALDEKGRSPLACCFKHPNGGKKHRIDVARHLLVLGASPDAMLGTTPLICRAAQLNNITWVQLIIKYKGNVNVKNEDGRTPLMIVATLEPALQLTPLFKFLLQSGADVNVVDNNGLGLWQLAQKHHNLSQLTPCVSKETFDQDWLRIAMVDEILFPILEKPHSTHFTPNLVDSVDVMLLIDKLTKYIVRGLQEGSPDGHTPKAQSHGARSLGYLLSVFRVTVPEALSEEQVSSIASAALDISLVWTYSHQVCYHIIELLSHHPKWPSALAERLLQKLIDSVAAADIRLNHVPFMKLLIPFTKNSSITSKLISLGAEIEKSLGLRLKSLSQLRIDHLHSQHVQPLSQDSMSHLLLLPVDAVHNVMLHLDSESDLISLIHSCRYLRSAFLAVPDVVFRKLLVRFALTTPTKSAISFPSAKEEFKKRISMRQKSRADFHWRPVVVPTETNVRWHSIRAPHPSLDYFVLTNWNSEITVGARFNPQTHVLDVLWRMVLPVKHYDTRMSSAVPHPLTGTIAYIRKIDVASTFEVYNPATKVSVSHPVGELYHWIQEIGTRDHTHEFVIAPGEVWTVTDGAELKKTCDLLWPQTLTVEDGEIVNCDEIEAEFKSYARYHSVPNDDNCILTSYFHHAWLYDLRDGKRPQWSHSYPQKHSRGFPIAPAFRTSNSVWMTNSSYQLFEVDLRKPEKPVWIQDLILYAPSFDTLPGSEYPQLTVATTLNATASQAFFAVQFAQYAPLMYNWDLSDSNRPELRLVNVPDPKDRICELVSQESGLAWSSVSDAHYFASFE